MSLTGFPVSGFLNFTSDGAFFSASQDVAAVLSIQFSPSGGAAIVGGFDYPHSHAFTDVSGVAAASHAHNFSDLAGVAAASHSHVYSQLLGVAPTVHNHTVPSKIDVISFSYAGDGSVGGIRDILTYSSSLTPLFVLLAEQQKSHGVIPFSEFSPFVVASNKLTLRTGQSWNGISINSAKGVYDGFLFCSKTLTI